MFRDHPLLNVLGRRGRGAMADALLNERDKVWTVRGLAREADIAPATAARGIQEFEMLGVLEVLRPGRDAQVRLLTETPMGAALERMRLPDVREETVRSFTRAFGRPAGVRNVLQWAEPEDDLADPFTPTRIAVVCDEAPDDALDGVGAALDAVTKDGWPAPDATVWMADDLDPEDPIAAAILAGRPVERPRGVL